MNTIELSKELKKHVTAAKPFVSKAKSRPILTATLVDENYIIATDSHRLIRIKHNENIQEPFIHEYKKGDDILDVHSYPDTHRLIPIASHATQTFTINTTEWLEAHKNGLVAAKEHDNLNIMLKGDALYVFPVLEKKGKYNKKERKYEKINVPLHEQLSYAYKLDDVTLVDNISYNCKYMIEALKVFKKYKHTEVKFHFYSIHRPFLLTAGDIEILILPIRLNN